MSERRRMIMNLTMCDHGGISGDFVRRLGTGLYTMGNRVLNDTQLSEFIVGCNALSRV